MRSNCAHCLREIDVEDEYKYRCYLCKGNVRKKRPNELTTSQIGTMLGINNKRIKGIVQQAINARLVKPSIATNKSRWYLFNDKDVEEIKKFAETKPKSNSGRKRGDLW